MMEQGDIGESGYHHAMYHLIAFVTNEVCQRFVVESDFSKHMFQTFKFNMSGDERRIDSQEKAIFMKIIKETDGGKVRTLSF